MEWIKTLNAAIDYIEENLDKELSYEDVAQVACCSVFYFQRIFTAICGISLSEYIRRRRMTQAAFELQRREAKVMDIALKYGYTSPTAFNRAFRQVHHISPKEAKKKENKLNAYPAIRFTVAITGECVMPYYIAEKPPMRIVGNRISLTQDMEKNWEKIPNFWRSFFKEKSFLKLCELSNQQPQGILGVSVSENSKENFYYIGVATDQPAPQGMWEYEIPAASWVIFEQEGDFRERVQNVFQRYYREWLPFSGYDEGGLAEIEIYPLCRERKQEGLSQVWFAIQKKGSKNVP